MDTTDNLRVRIARHLEEFSDLDAPQEEDSRRKVAEHLQLLRDLSQVLSQHRFPRADHLVGIKEIADFFGIPRTTVSGWTERSRSNGMPDPVKNLACGKIFDLQAVIVWWKHWEPTRGGAKSGSLPEGFAHGFDVTL